MTRYISVTDAVGIYGMSRTDILNACNARGQKFAFKPNGGKWRINKEKFENYLEKKEQGISRRIGK